MHETGVSSRELGRRLANGSLTAQAARRTVMKYLRGEVLPSPERQAQLADALGVERERLSLDEDEEEADLFAVLYTAVVSIARHEIRREFERRS